MTSSIVVTNASDTREKWGAFVNNLKSRRFFISKDEPFLRDHIQSIINQNVVEIKEGQILYRARINEDGRDFQDNELDAPPVDKVGNGRLNQRGISYLYVADSPSTAIAEVRPWLSAVVTVAEVKLLESIRVIDFVPKEKDGPKSYKRIVGDLFSRPVSPYSADLEYLPTQCIAEFIKIQGYDGIKYTSSLYPGGINYCLFNPKIVSVKISHKEKIDRIEYQSSKLEK